MKNLIEKYNKNIPRYTSYPPVPYWKNIPAQGEWIHHIAKNYDEKSGLDLYIHVPFCEKLCYYCGCNRTITKNHTVEEEYIDLVKKEWGIYIEKLGFTPKINSIHLGGGTPTFLSSKNLEELFSFLTKFKSERFFGSIEIDPRTVRFEQLDVLRKFNFTRVSLGIQDFDLDVQSAINRLQSFSMVETLVKEIRKKGFESINFDVIYGLPRQSLRTIEDTFNKILTLAPDLIAYYSYAHLPERIKNQKLIVTEELPSAAEKQALYDFGKQFMQEHGYCEVGMDHFALPSNYLACAQESKTLKRNFMGYTDEKSSVLVGLGPTSISDSGMSFIQNAKDYSNYKMQILKGELAITAGHVLTLDELKTQDYVMSIMCNEEAYLKFKNIPHWDEVNQDLNELAQDGLILFDDHHVKLTAIGKKFVRNVANVFDFHQRQNYSNIKFSKSV